MAEKEFEAAASVYAKTNAPFETVALKLLDCGKPEGRKKGDAEGMRGCREDDRLTRTEKARKVISRKETAAFFATSSKA